MKISIAQMNPIIFDLEHNFQLISNAIQKAKSDGADIVAFPEMALTGYPPRDLLHHQGLLDNVDLLIQQRILPETKGIAVLLGAPYRENSQLYNAAYFIVDGEIRQIIKKKNLPNYEVFYEARYFQAGEMNAAQDFIVEYKGEKIAVLICEDFLSGDYTGDYNFADCKFDRLICLSASPFRVGKPTYRQEILKKAWKQFKVPIALVNQVGAHDELIFDGHSAQINTSGEITQGPGFIEYIGELNQPYDLPENRLTNVKNAIILGIRDYFAKTGFKKAYIGLSGGIDSAVVACLAAEALGGENVQCLLMPSHYSSQGSIDDALALSEALGVSHQIISIEEPTKHMLEHLELGSLTLEEQNLQARLRGMTLMAYANRDNALVLTTSNKSELAVGYSTLYGDSCGALAPIADLWKTEVYQLAELYPAIPQAILEKAPSAELAPEQQDSDSLPEYNILDPILERIIVGKKTAQELISEGHKESLISDILRKVKLSQFKRKQYATVIKVSNCSFGIDWQYPILS